MQSFHNYLKDLNNPKTKDLIKDTIYYDAQIPNISANLNKGIQPRGKNYNNFDELHNRANEGLDIIDGIQKGMNTFKFNDDDDFPIKIDGKFGAKTQSAWDRYAKANIPDKPNYLQGIIAPKKPPSLNIFQDKSPAATRFREKAFDDLLKQLQPESSYKTTEYRFPDYENRNEKNQSKAENLPYVIHKGKDSFENTLLKRPRQGVVNYASVNDVQTEPKISNQNSDDSIYNYEFFSAQKPNMIPRKDKRHGSEKRQPSGARERNVAHPNGEEHSIKSKKPSLPNKGPNVSRIDDVGKAVVGGAAVVGTGYLIYRGIRLLPSLLPHMWWTLPANLLIA